MFFFRHYELKTPKRLICKFVNGSYNDCLEVFFKNELFYKIRIQMFLKANLLILIVNPLAKHTKHFNAKAASILDQQTFWQQPDNVLVHNATS